KNGLLTIDIDAIKKVQIEEMYGNSIFSVVYKNKVIELNRYTQTVSSLFKDASDYINKDDKTTGESNRDREGTNRCPKCGRVLGRKSNICFYCIDKKKVLVRLMGYVKPYLGMTIAGLICSIIVAAIGL